MTKLTIYALFIFGASLIGWNTLPSSHEEVKEFTSDKTAEIYTENTIELDEPTLDHYEEYLAVLGAQGPKESNPELSLITVESQSNDIELPKTSERDEKNDNIVDEKVVMNKQQEATTGNEIEAVGIVDHSAFGKLLQKHVNSKGNVDYAGFKKDEAKLDAYLNKLRANPVTSDMSKNTRLAYWINVYNAFTIKLILENYPVKSIQDIAGGKPWDKVFIKLGSTSYSLNNVENDIIRKKFTEPRIHFAVNCAAKSCPPLLNDAYYPETLIDQLAERTKSFISNNAYNTITKNKLEVSKIFDWYGKDFGDVKRYIDRNTSIDVSGLDLQFKEYDWTLNKQ